MSERQNNDTGTLFDANTTQLIQERQQAKKLLHMYNTMNPDDMDGRTSLLRSLLGRAGACMLIEQPFYCDYGYNIMIGDHFYANFGCVILDGATVTIGDHVFLAPGVGIYTAGHPLDTQKRNQGLEYALPVAIGDNVWIGGNSVILPGVSIGDNAVIGAGSVVNRDIPAGVLAAGNPCAVRRNIDDSIG